MNKTERKMNWVGKDCVISNVLYLIEKLKIHLKHTLMNKITWWITQQEKVASFCALIIRLALSVAERSPYLFQVIIIFPSSVLSVIKSVTFLWISSFFPWVSIYSLIYSRSVKWPWRVINENLANRESYLILSISIRH